MEVIEVSPSNKNLIREFIDLPFRIYKEIPQWVPAFRFADKARFDKRKNPFYKHSDAAFFLAFDGTQAVGRIAIIDNRLHNEHNNEKTAFFYLFECENNIEAAQLLFDAGSSWAKKRGLDLLSGPKGFTPLDGFGLLVKGFDHRPALGIPYNPPYYVDLIENSGFELIRESVSGYITTTMVFPKRIHELADRIRKRRGLITENFHSRKDLRRFVGGLKDLYNGALAGMEGGTPITQDEADSLASQMLWFANPNLIKIIKKIDPDKGEDELVGFLFAYPDISKAVQKTKGKLFPFGWMTMLMELRNTDWININGAGLREDYRGLGGTAILFSEMEKSVRASSKFKHADIVQIGMENDRMQREMANFGIDFYKNHNLYQKSIK
ncbi:MAG TPA: hypothetical protein VJZ78_00650 [Anaerolineales bacterium]|nr:hypothetical protein [Anaerolineales bacterium]